MSAPESVQVDIPEAYRELFTPARYKVYYGGRGSGKSWAFATALVVMGASRPIRVLCAREFQGSIAESVHKLLEQRIDALGLGGFYEVQRQSIRGRNGTEFFFEGIRHNTQKIKSMEGVDYAWLEEGDRTSDESLDILIPTIRKPGSEIWVSMNTGHQYDAVWQRFVESPPPAEVDGKPYCVARKVSWRDNPWFPDELRVELEQLKATDPDKYLHIWEGELRNLAEGAIYGKQLLQARQEGRITDVPIQPGAEVHTFWDLGHSDATAIWCAQVVGPQYRFIDYIEGSQEPLSFYIHALKERGYNYGRHYLPHDVEHQILGMDRTRKEQLLAGGIRPIEVVERVRDVTEGIEMTRQVFPSCWFDATRCERGIEALSNYRYKYDEQRKAYMPRPLHDWASNGADAFRQFAQGFRTGGNWGQAVASLSPVRKYAQKNANPWGATHAAMEYTP